MPDIMQANRLQQSTKFAEGRLKLSTSCVECHRRKQKCDRKQPCGHCVRRYPPPPCIYRTLRDISSSSKDQSELPESQIFATGLQLAEYGTSMEATFASGGNQSKDKQRNYSSGRIMPEDEQQFIHTESELELPHVSFETLGQFSSDKYQQLVTTMVSDLSSAVLRESFVAEAPFLKLSKGAENRSPRVLQGDYGEYEQSNENAYFKNNSLQLGAVPPPSHFSISAVEPLYFLGITPTFQSAQLLQAFLKIICKYVVSIDGNNSPNYYNDYWVPWSVKSPLLAHLAILTSAIYQAEAQKIPPAQSPIVLRYKVKSIELLNEMLGHKNSATSPEAIAAVIYLMVNEWYWCNHDVVQRHIAGLKEMVRLRGGLDNLGMSGFVRKMVLHIDYNVACSYDIEPAFPHNVQSRPQHPVEMSIPFVVAEQDFNSSTGQLQISEQTAAILDDMRFLFLALTKHAEQDPSEQEQMKLTTTATWIRDRVASLPDGTAVDSPLASDFIYKSCRIASLIYCKAILERTALSKVCTLQELSHLWLNMWQVKLSRWKKIPGIFLFVISAGLSAAERTPHGRFTKAMFKTTTSYIGLDYFELVDAALMALVKLQRWLRTGGERIDQSSKPVPLDFIHIYER